MIRVIKSKEETLFFETKVDVDVDEIGRFRPLEEHLNVFLNDAFFFKTVLKVSYTTFNMQENQGDLFSFATFVCACA